MKNYKIDFIDELTEDMERRMTKGFVEYETSHGIDVNYKKFAVVLTNEDNIAFAILNAFTAFSEVYIEDLWVDKAYRGQGYGRKLLEELENRFKGKGFNNINLVTSAFNSPEFYKKCGFEVEFVRKNPKNPKLTKTFFVKYFEDDVQNQGVLKKTSD
jgi:ribosomal protein S18 acetylase RimI-like enzyme